MCSIYMKATEVLVWLSAKTKDSNVGAEFISVVASKLRELDLSVLGSLQKVLERPDFPRSEDPRWSALLHLLCRPWFGRIWIQQEAWLASSISFSCGNVDIPSADLIFLGASIQDSGLEDLFYVALAGNFGLF